MRRTKLFFLTAVLGIACVISGCGSKGSTKQTTAAVTTEAPTAEPTTEEPTTVEPTTEEPTTEEPTTVEPTTEEPTTEEQKTQEPAPTDDTAGAYSPEAEKAMEFFTAMYEKIDPETLPNAIEQHEADLTDADMLKFQTGLDSAEGVSNIVISESMIGSVAYSIMYVTLEEGTDSGEFMDKLLKSVDPRKWICVEADYVYANTFDDDVFLMMVKADFGDTVYNAAVKTAEEMGMKVGTRKGL